MAKCKTRGKCREMLGCKMGLCAKDVDDHLDEWAEEHSWD